MGRRLDTWPYGRTATMDVTYTQANAGGGAIVCDITPGSGCEFIIMAFRQINSGTNSCNLSLTTTAGGTQIVLIGLVASGAGTTMYVSPGSVATGWLTTAGSAGLGYPFIVSGVQTLKAFQGGAGAQNDTMRVLINIRVKGGLPTVIHSNSTNPANVSVTAGAESFATV